MNSTPIFDPTVDFTIVAKFRKTKKRCREECKIRQRAIKTASGLVVPLINVGNDLGFTTNNEENYLRSFHAISTLHQHDIVYCIDAQNVSTTDPDNRTASIICGKKGKLLKFYRVSRNESGSTTHHYSLPFGGTLIVASLQENGIAIEIVRMSIHRCGKLVSLAFQRVLDKVFSGSIHLDDLPENARCFRLHIKQILQQLGNRLATSTKKIG